MSQNDNNPDKERRDYSHIQATTLDDIGAVLVVVTVNRPDGRQVDVTMRALPESEVWALRRSVKWPKPPIKDYKKTGGDVNPVLDYQDEGYREGVNDANRLLGQKMLLASLQLAIPGETETEKIAALEDGIGQYAFTILVAASQELNIVGAEELANVARSFRPVGAAGASGNGAAGPDAGPVAEPAAE